MSQVTVASINLRNRMDRWRERRGLLVAEIVDNRPDLVGLQEISFPIRQGNWLQKQVNLRLPPGAPPYQLIQKRKRHLIRGYYEGIGILSRLPLLYHDYVNLGYGGRLALRAHVRLPNQQTLDFVCVHLHHVAADREARLEQVMRLTGWLESRRHVPLQIVVGDFNEAPTGLAIERMKQGFRSAYAAVHGHEPLATFPTALVQPLSDWSACLDYIFLSPAVRQVKSARLWCDQPAKEDDTLFPSDHVGLLATVVV